jgi:hypothetical protein
MRSTIGRYRAYELYYPMNSSDLEMSEEFDARKSIA